MPLVECKVPDSCAPWDCAICDRKLCPCQVDCAYGIKDLESLKLLTDSNFIHMYSTLNRVPNFYLHYRCADSNTNSALDVCTECLRGLLLFFSAEELAKICTYKTRTIQTKASLTAFFKHGIFNEQS